MIGTLLTPTETVLVVLAIVAAAAGLVRDHHHHGSAAIVLPSAAIVLPSAPSSQPERDPDAVTAVEIHNIGMAVLDDEDIVTDDGGRYWLMDSRWWCIHHGWLGIQRVADPRVIDALNARARRAFATTELTITEHRRVARG